MLGGGGGREGGVQGSAAVQEAKKPTHRLLRVQVLLALLALGAGRAGVAISVRRINA